MWEKIERFLVERNMTMYQLSKLAGLKHNVLIDLKAGKKRDILFGNAEKIADALDVSLDEFRRR